MDNSISSMQKLIVFQVEQNYYCMPSEEIRSVGIMRSVRSLPVIIEKSGIDEKIYFNLPWVLGRSKIYAHDCKIIKLKNAGFSTDQRDKLKERYGLLDPECFFIIDDVLEEISIEINDLKPLPAFIRSHKKIGFLSASLFLKDKMAVFINANKIIKYFIDEYSKEIV